MNVNSSAQRTVIVTGGNAGLGYQTAKSSAESYDEARAAELWRVSAELVGLPAAAAEGDSA